MTARGPFCWLARLGTALLMLTVFALLLDIPGTVDDARIVRVATLVGLLVLSSAVYFAAVRLVLRHTWPRRTLWAVLGVAIALRILLLIPPPILSTDIYRYVCRIAENERKRPRSPNGEWKNAGLTMPPSE